MVDVPDPQQIELSFQDRWHQAHCDAYAAEHDIHAPYWRDESLVPLRGSGLQLLADLRNTRDLAAFQSASNQWARTPGSAFGGTAGQMIINQINKRAPNSDEAVTILLAALTTPSDLDQAAHKIQRLEQYLESIKVGAHPLPSRAPFVASYFWGLDDPITWPVAWPHSTNYLEFCTGNTQWANQGERYRYLYEIAQRSSGGPKLFERVASWWAQTQPIILDDVLCDRAALRYELELPAHLGELQANAQALLAVARHIGGALTQSVLAATGHQLKARYPSIYWKKDTPRGDFWVEWRVPKTYGLGFRIWLNRNGVAIGLRPYPQGGTESTQAALELFKDHELDGFEVLANRGSAHGRDVGLMGVQGEILFGRWFDRSQLPSVELAREVQDAARQIQPLLDELAGTTKVHEPNLSSGTSADVIAEDDSDLLTSLADELLVDGDFIEEIVDLLGRERQLIFYGPPGTGKTYFAQKLTEALAPEAPQRAIVQFHPATSYEDFFEGYRPHVDAHGSMTYRLVPGPLAQLAERAQVHPDQPHIMVIDEINRANLPKVLGEMLFLLEYRDTPVKTLYRPDQPFQLPPNLWFIGTMNTSDRSIALLDAALRRRFQFIPFFPNSDALAGLLERWLKHNDEPAWVAEIVAQVNDELRQTLGGEHLLLGTSYFMKPGLTVDKMRQIWQYSIEPLIEDQLFGDAASIDRFRFAQVLQRYEESIEGSIGDPAQTPSDDA